VTQPQFEEPPELLDSSGEKIVQFRRPDGTIFSNHPEYNLAPARHERDKAEAGGVEEVEEDDVPQEPDNEDGTVTYEEMTSQQLVALAKERDIELVDRKRSTAIKALQDWDAEQAEKAGS
jgi:hypothetical protein